MLLPEFFVLLLLLLAVVWVFIWVFVAGYFYLVSACFICFSSSCNNSGLEQMVLALWCSEPTTLYFDDTVWLLSPCKYRSVCVGFQYTVVLRLPSSFGITKMSKKGMVPSSLDSSLVNYICSSMLLRWSRKLVFWDDLMIVKVSSTNYFQNWGVVVLNLWL